MSRTSKTFYCAACLRQYAKLYSKIDTIKFGLYQNRIHFFDNSITTVQSYINTRESEKEEDGKMYWFLSWLNHKPNLLTTKSNRFRLGTVSLVSKIWWRSLPRGCTLQKLLRGSRSSLGMEIRYSANIVRYESTDFLHRFNAAFTRLLWPLLRNPYSIEMWYARMYACVRPTQVELGLTSSGKESSTSSTEWRELRAQVQFLDDECRTLRRKVGN